MSETDAPAPNGAPPLSTYGVKDTDSVTVYDPKTNGLKVATGAQAKALAAQGFKIGVEAEYEAKKNDGLSQAGTYLTHAGNTGSFGLLNLGLAASGRRGDLINEQEASEANQGSAIAGDLTGIAASIYGGGLAGGLEAKVGGKIASRLAGNTLAKVGQSAAGSGRFASLGKAALGHASQGLFAAATQGISDEAVQDTVLKHPMTAEKLAQAAFTDIVWNSAINLGVHGLVSLPKYLRNGGGNLLERLEKFGVIEREMVKVPVDPGSEPAMTGFTIKRKGGYSDVTTTESNIRDFEREMKETRTKTNDYDREMKKTGTVVTDDDTVRHSTTKRTSTNKPGPDVLVQPPEDSAFVNALKQDEPLPKSSVAEGRAGFEWDGHTKEQKIAVLRKAMHWHLDKVPENLAIWNENAANEKLIEKFQEVMKDSKDPKEILSAHKEINRLIQEKKAAKDLLTEAHPRDVQADGLVVPGFRDINDEWARVEGKIPYNDVDVPNFGVKVPDVKGGAKAKPIKPRVEKTRIRESTSETNATSNRDKNVQSDSLLTDTSQRVQQENHNIEDTIRDDRTKVKNVKTDQDMHEVTIRYKVPKAAPEFVKGDYKRPFDPRMIGIVAGGAHYAGPLAPLGYAAAGAMQTANTIAYLGNYRKPIGQFFEKYGTKLAKTFAYPAAVAGRAALQKRKRDRPIGPDLSHYEAAAASVNSAATNAEAVHAYIQKKYPEVAQQHPETINQVYATVMRGVHALDQIQAKKPYAPTLQQNSFQPPRAQQVKFMRAWRTLANTDEALEDADPQTMEMLRTVFPAWHDTANKELMHKVQEAKQPLRGRMARQVSSFTGSHVRPIDDPATLKRLQETAGPAPKPEAGQPQNGNPKSTGGAKSAKITQAAVSADATSFQQREMGL